MPLPHNGCSVFISFLPVFTIWLSASGKPATDLHPCLPPGNAGRRTASRGRSRIVFDVFHYHLRVAQRVRSLQLVARIGHFGHQAADPRVQLQLQQSAVLSGTNVLALNQLQVVGDTRQKEDVRKTGVDAAVRRRISGVIQRRFLSGVG